MIDTHYAKVIGALFGPQDSVDVDLRVVYETGEKGTLQRTLALMAVGAS